MMNLSGIWYRIYTEVPFWFLCGAIILIIDFFTIKKRRKTGKRIGLETNISCFIGIAAIIASSVILAHYIHTISSPDIKSIDCVFIEEYRDSTVAPPLPFTNGYIFREVGKSNSIVVYLDTFSAKNIITEDLVEGKMYTVWYSTVDNIIVQLTPSS